MPLWAQRPTDALPNGSWHVQGSLWSDTSPVRQAGSTTLFWRLKEFDSKGGGGSGQLDLMPIWEMFNSLPQTWKGCGCGYHLH